MILKVGFLDIFLSCCLTENSHSRTVASHFERRLDPCFFRHKTFYGIFAIFQNVWKISTCNILKGHKLTILFHGGQFPLLMFLFSLFLSVQISFSASFPLSAWACLSFTFFAFFSLCFSPQNSCFFIVFTLSHSLFKKYLFIYLFIYLFSPLHAACWILVPWPGIEPASPAVEVWSLNHWTARDVSLSHTPLTVHNIELYFNINICVHIYLTHAHRSLNNLK